MILPYHPELEGCIRINRARAMDPTSFRISYLPSNRTIHKQLGTVAQGYQILATRVI